MATHKLGKLKINTSQDGLAFRFGEGEIHRLKLFGRKRRNGEGEYGEEYNNNEEEYLGPEGYEDGDFAPEEDYAEEDYAPDGYSGRFSRSDGDASYADDYG